MSPCSPDTDPIRETGLLPDLTFTWWFLPVNLGSRPLLWVLWRCSGHRVHPVKQNTESQLRRSEKICSGISFLKLPAAFQLFHFLNADFLLTCVCSVFSQYALQLFTKPTSLKWKREAASHSCITSRFISLVPFPHCESGGTRSVRSHAFKCFT